jgi:NAD(P)H dehydrogenase (quinone)
VRNRETADAWIAKGADVSIASLDDARALEAAFGGAKALFVMLPPYFGSPDSEAEYRAAIEAVRSAVVAAHVPYIVYLSSIGSHRTNGLGAITKTYALEQAMRALDAPSVAIRAGWFMENYRGQIGTVERTGRLASMLDPLERTVPMIATEDIGQVAAALLQARRDEQRVVELATGEYSCNDAARILSSVLGRDVTAYVVPGIERVEMYQSWGCSPSAAHAMSEMIDGFNSGWIAFEGGNAERLSGTTTLETVLEQLAAQTRSSAA